jgi:cytochrome c-type biogenesis protein CcmE
MNQQRPPSVNRRRTLYALGTGLLLAFAGFAFTSFKQEMTPYVGFREAQTLGRTLQVAGALVKGSSSYADGALLFTIEEPGTGETMRVVYRGVKPANFEEALSVVAIGAFDAGRGTLEAEKLLVKCPSKYQGVEGAEVKEYGKSG